MAYRLTDMKNCDKYISLYINYSVEALGLTIILVMKYFYLLSLLGLFKVDQKVIYWDQPKLGYI